MLSHWSSEWGWIFASIKPTFGMVPLHTKRWLHTHNAVWSWCNLISNTVVYSVHGTLLKVRWGSLSLSAQHPHMHLDRHPSLNVYLSAPAQTTIRHQSACAPKLNKVYVTIAADLIVMVVVVVVMLVVGDWTELVWLIVCPCTYPASTSWGTKVGSKAINHGIINNT